VKEWVARLVREQGKTVVLTTHQLDIAQELCDRVAIMRRGKLLADQPLDDLLRLFKQERYQIRLWGEISPQQAARFQPLALTQENGTSLLSGEIHDQPTLHRYLDEIRTLNLPLISVARVEADLEDVFLQLMQEHQTSR
jgi:ABC-2 type transport system ATP-binding protein